MRDVRVALVVGLALLAVGVVLVAVHHPDVLARSNGRPEHALASIRSRTTLCQARETIPRGTTAIVLWLEAFTGPRVSIRLLAGGHVVARGERSSGWTGWSVTVPLEEPIAHATRATVCATLAPHNETVIPRGNDGAGSAVTIANAHPLEGMMTIEYLRPGGRTWWSRASTIAHHLGFGRASSGDWAPILATLLSAVVVILTSSIVLRRRG